MKPRTMRTSRRNSGTSVWLATALYLLVSPAFAQIEVPEATPVNRIAKLRAVNTIPDGAKVKRKWTADAGIDLVPSETGKLAYVTAGKPGRYRVVLTEAVATGDNLSLEDYPATVVFGEPGPEPQPPEPPQPTLAELAGKDAATVASYLRVLAGEVSTIPSDTAFWQIWDATFPAKANTALDTALKARVAEALQQSPQTLSKSLIALADEISKPEPQPQPTPAPIPVSGLHVLIIEETDDRGSLPSNQLGVLQTTEIQSYVKSRGGEFRQYDDDPEIADPLWRAARDRPRTTLPWLIISNGLTGYEGPIGQMTVADVLELIRKYELN